MRALEFILETVSAGKVLDYVNDIHPAEEKTAALDSLILSFDQYELKTVAVDQLQIDADEDPHGRVIYVDTDYASDITPQDIKRKPIVIDAQGHILDGNHRAWQARELGITHVPAYVAVKELTEAFNQPYPLAWNKSEHGDYDALARLSDGTNLSIMFNDEGDEEWQVVFDRNHSQEVTGEGDALRIFATVLTAIQQFIQKEHPWRIKFSASKDVGSGRPSESRAKLYDRLVQRYAQAWGYDEYNEDHGDQVTYELTKIEHLP